MTRRAGLVLSGGGAKGAFQAAVERRLRRHDGYQWEAVFGVSVGALNGAMIAAGDQFALRHVWLNEIQGDRSIHSGGLSVWRVLQLVLGRKRSLYDLDGLEELVLSYLPPDSDAYQVPVRVGAVDLETGRYHAWSPGDVSDFGEAVLASATQPVVWEPQRVGELQNVVDGGLRNITPLGDAIELLPPDVDEIVVILCQRPSDRMRPTEELGGIDDVALRTLDILLDETLRNDVATARRINRLVQQAADGKVELTTSSGRPLRPFRIQIVEPTEDLGSGLDFSPETIQRRWQIGERTATQFSTRELSPQS